MNKESKELTTIEKGIKTLDDLSDIMFEIKILGNVLKSQKESQRANYQRTGFVNGIYLEEIEKTKQEVFSLENRYQQILKNLAPIESIVDTMDFNLTR